MAEYIERETVLADELTHCLPYSVGKAAGRVVVFVSDIDAIPAADVAPVVHGRWEFVADEYCSTAHCTNCGKGQGLYINGRKPDWNYCPNCGARMDGE